MWIGRFFCLLALFALSGLDRAAVQTYAWATMLHDRAPEIGLTEAIDSTFSGDMPCEICTALTKTQSEQQKAPNERPAEELPKLYSPPAPHSAALLKNRSQKSSLRHRDVSHEDLCSLEIPTPPPEFG